MTLVCVTPNPALDRTLRVPGFAAGGVWRATACRTACGGKGINVARALARLGRTTLSIGPLGGKAGPEVAAAMATEGLDGRWTAIAGETRSCLIIVDDLGQSTVINEPGPRITRAEWSAFSSAVVQAAKRAQAVCIGGSLPPGWPDGGFRELAAATRAQVGEELWVDGSGAALREAAAASACIKINSDEANALLGGKIVGERDAVAAAQAIRALGPPRVVITLGADGAVLAEAEGAWRVSAPRVTTVSAVGSGDCFLAGLVSMLAEGRSVEAALALAAACGAANAQRADVASFTRAEAGAIAARAHVERMDVSQA